MNDDALQRAFIGKNSGYYLDKFLGFVAVIVGAFFALYLVMPETMDP